MAPQQASEIETDILLALVITAYDLRSGKSLTLGGPLSGAPGLP